jgi:hypothetical protein
MLIKYYQRTISPKSSAPETAGAIAIFISAVPYAFCKIAYLQAFGNLQL